MIAASWILVVVMMFNGPKPEKKDAAENGDESAEVENGDASKKEGENSDPADDSKGGNKKDAADPGKDGKKQSDSEQAAKDGENQKGQQDENGDKDDSESKGQPETPKRRQVEQKFISVGSLATDSSYRFLATFDSHAGSIHRLELVQRRKKSERLKYKDLEIRYGYLGHLDLKDENDICIIQTVGNGTPAAAAGLQVGDVITRFDDAEVKSRLDFETALRKTKHGQEIVLTYTRGGKEQTATAKLARQPLEVIRPTSVPELAEFAFANVDFRKSYSLSLFEPLGSTWKPIGNAQDENWEAEVGDDFVRFYYPYKDETEIKKAGIGYQVIKTFKLPVVTEEDRDNVSAKNYHIDFDVEVKNLTDEPKSYAYRLDGPNGLPTEDWWFAIKIHGEWSAVFSQAGARDVVASTTSRSFHFIGGPKIYTNGTKANQKKPLYVIDPSSENDNAHDLNYIGVDSHYFVSALIPTNSEGEMAPRYTYSAYAMPQFVKMYDEDKTTDPQRKKEAKWYRKLVPVNFKAYFSCLNLEAEEAAERHMMAPNQSVKHTFMIFAGPKEPALLQEYNIDDTVTYGWFAAFSWPLVKLLHLFFAIIGNYAIAIVLLTVLVRLAMMRFSRKMVLNSQMMQLLAPEIKAIAEKYKDDFQAKSRAQQELFKKYNYNPFSGCLVMLIQLPVFIGLYRGLSVDMALRDQPLIPGVEWCSNLAGPDQLWRWADSLPAYMSFLTHETGWLGPYFNILPIISVVLMLIQQKLFTPPPTDEQQAMMQKVMTFMMVFIGVIFFKVPAGLCIYFITSTLWAILEKKLVPPPQLPEHLQERLDKLKELQAKEKEDGVEPGTYTAVKTTAGGNATRKHTDRAKKKSQKNRRK